MGTAVVIAVVTGAVVAVNVCPVAVVDGATETVVAADVRGADDVTGADDDVTSADSVVGTAVAEVAGAVEDPAEAVVSADGGGWSLGVND